MMLVRVPLRLYAACAFGVVVTGRLLDDLPSDQQAAVIAHEQGHSVMHHGRTRLWWLLTSVLRSESGLALRCRAQEFEADEYAAARGHARALADFLASLRHTGVAPHALHPPITERIARLLSPERTLE